MKKEQLKIYKETIEAVKGRDELVAASIYKTIWQDMILQYIVATNHDTFNLYIDRYIENITEYTKRVLISKLVKDGFVLKTNDELPTLYVVSKENVEKYIENISKKKNEQIKMPITPAAETRSR